MKSKLLISFYCTSLLFVAPFNIESNASPLGVDNSRIYKAMSKAARGEEIVICVLGGSITKGYAASSENTKWANLVADWWKNKFKKAKIKLINAGIGGTGSDFGTHRVQGDVLAFNPDFIVVEFAVNDTEGPPYVEKMYEGLLRQILSDKNLPGLMLLMLKAENGTTAQAAHKIIGKHYGVPVVSFADQADAAVAAQGKTLHDLFVDGLHPNDLGMSLIARFITEKLETIYTRLPADFKESSISRNLPAPLVTDTYAKTVSYDFICDKLSVKPLANKGWYCADNVWKADKPGDSVIFSFEGSSVSLLIEKHNVGSYGKIDYRVDNGLEKTLDSFWKETWGPAQRFLMLAEGLSNGKHTLFIKVRSDKSESSTGNTVRILKIMSAGSRNQ
jgi:lysophospholipase L1-like esterase